MIIYKDLDMKNKRDEYFQQLDEYKSMIEKLTKICANQQVIINAKDHRHEAMIEEIKCMRIKNEKFERTLSEFTDKIHLAKTVCNLFKNKKTLLEKDLKELKNQQLDFDALFTYIVQKKGIKTIKLVQDSINMLRHCKSEVEIKENLKFQFEHSQKDKNGHFWYYGIKLFKVSIKLSL